MKNFHHISLLTRDKEKNLAFYTEFLGLRFIKNTVNQENHRMLHWYYGDYAGTPGTVITFLWFLALAPVMITNTALKQSVLICQKIV